MLAAGILFAAGSPARALRRGRTAWADSLSKFTATALRCLPVLRPCNASQQIVGTYTYDLTRGPA